mgnify:CR=1 FL=1
MNSIGIVCTDFQERIIQLTKDIQAIEFEENSIVEQLIIWALLITGYPWRGGGGLEKLESVLNFGEPQFSEGSLSYKKYFKLNRAPYFRHKGKVLSDIFSLFITVWTDVIQKPMLSSWQLPVNSSLL